MVIRHLSGHQSERLSTRFEHQDRSVVIDIPRAVILPRDIWGSFIAQGDLMELSHSLWCLLRLKAEDLPLYEYGLNDEQRERFVRRYRRYTPTKLQRRIVRLRAMGQRLGAAPAETGAPRKREREAGPAQPIR